MLFKIDVLKNFATFTGKHLFLPLQVFFFKTPTMAASAAANTFLANSGIYCWGSHQLLFRTPLKTGVKPQKQPLELFCKKRCSKKFFKFHRKAPVLKSVFNRGVLTNFSNFTRKYQKRDSGTDVFLWILQNFS